MILRGVLTCTDPISESQLKLPMEESLAGTTTAEVWEGNPLPIATSLIATSPIAANEKLVFPPGGRLLFWKLVSGVVLRDGGGGRFKLLVVAPSLGDSLLAISFTFLLVFPPDVLLRSLCAAVDQAASKPGMVSMSL